MDPKGKSFYCEDCPAGAKLIPTLIGLECELDAIKARMKGSTALSENSIVNEIHEHQRQANNIMLYNLTEQNNDMNDVKNITKNVGTYINIQVIQLTR